MGSNHLGGHTWCLLTWQPTSPHRVLIHTHTQSVFTSINALKQNWIPNIVCAWVGLIHVSVQRNYGIGLLVWWVWTLSIFFKLYTYFIYQPFVLFFRITFWKLLSLLQTKQGHLTSPKGISMRLPRHHKSHGGQVGLLRSLTSETGRYQFVLSVHIVHTCNISVVKEHMMIRDSCQRLSDDQMTMQSTNTPTHAHTTTSMLISWFFKSSTWEIIGQVLIAAHTHTAWIVERLRWKLDKLWVLTLAFNFYLFNRIEPHWGLS